MFVCVVVLCCDDFVCNWLEQMVGMVDFFVYVDCELCFLYVFDVSLCFIGYYCDYLYMLMLCDLIVEQDILVFEGLFVCVVCFGQVEKVMMCIVKLFIYLLDVEICVFKSCYYGVDGFVIVVFDVLLWCVFEVCFMYEMYYDLMMGFDNLFVFVLVLMCVQQIVDEYGICVVLLLFDFDDYQWINCVFGYDVGDMLLCEIVQWLKVFVMLNEWFVCVVSDKFVVVLNVLDCVQVSQVVDVFVCWLQVVVCEFYVYYGQIVYLFVSIGIVFYFDECVVLYWVQYYSLLLCCVDYVFLQVKVLGGNVFVFYVFVDDLVDVECFKFEVDLYDGVCNGEFLFYFQLIMCSQLGVVVGVEVLICWCYLVYGFVLLVIFILFVELIGLINYFGNWVFKVVCMQFVVWDGQGFVL